MGVSPATFDYAKLDWMNGVYLRDLAPDAYADALVGFLRERGIDWDEGRVRAAAPLVQEKIGRLGEFPGFAGFLFGDVEPDPAQLDRGILEAAATALGAVPEWSAASIEAALKALCDELGQKPRQVFGPIRVAVTGSRISPGLYESLELLGRDVSLARLRRRRGARSVSGALVPDAFEEQLAAYLRERSEESRAVRVGEKETSEQAAIVARYAGLFTRPQLEALAAAEEGAEGDARERLYRLRKTCEGGIVTAELAERDDALENALLAARVEWNGEQVPLRTAQALLATTPAYADRDTLGERQLAVSAGFNDERRDLLAAHEELYAEPLGRARPGARGTRRRRASRCGSCATRSTRPACRRPLRSTGCGPRGSSACSGPSGTPCRRPRTRAGCDGSRRWPTRTRRSAPCRCAWRRSTGSGSTSRTSAASGSTSRTGRRSRRAPA